MRIFLSYASEEENLANQIRLKLQDAGYDVFFSAASIRASEGYDDRIRQEMAASDRMLFIASPASLAAGCYTQTELALAEQRWPNPKGRVMTVLEGVGPGDLPPYLGAVSSAVSTKGDPAAHVTATVLERWPKTMRRFLKPAIWTLAIAAVLTASGLWYAQTKEQEEKDRTRAARTSSKRQNPGAFRLGLEAFRRAEEEALVEKAPMLVEAIGKLLALQKLVAKPATEPPADIPTEPGARLERLTRLAAWAYPHGDTPEERVAARAKLISPELLRAMAKIVTGGPYMLTEREPWLETHIAPGSDEPLKDWFVQAWTRKLDPADPFDLREGNRLITGTPHEDKAWDWPPEATPRLLSQIRMMMEGLGGDDHIAKGLIIISLAAGKLERYGWKAPHAMGIAYAEAIEEASRDSVSFWRSVRSDANTYLINEYTRQYEGP